MLPAFDCGQYGYCNPYDGQCECPPGWAGTDCLTPQCDSLADGTKRRPREPGESCECKDGWEGINCNVCKTNQACAAFPLAGGPEDDDAEINPEDMVCYKGGETVFNNHQMCDVTNQGIVKILDGRKPQVTFSCDKNSSECSFQFWVQEVESFYCALDSCASSVQIGVDKNVTRYECDKIKCKCVPGRFICGENGSVDISDFLTEEIKGPASFRCTTGAGCRFEEPGMNDLIDEIFGDPYITLKCEGGECVHFSQVPGYVRPEKPDNTKMLALSAAGVGVLVILVCAILWYVGRARTGDLSKIRLPEDETARLMTEHTAASLQFQDVSYTLPGRSIISDITGQVKPGQLLAIMGASGAGKSTFLDILARKNKRGLVGGSVKVNGREVGDAEYRKVVGFVDQEDTLMSTLTVYETVLYSALLRLPREMSFAAKEYRTLETLQELGILGIKDSRIGESGRRSISGGEKRRVSIACELVTSPSILFLDEPTSGLDAYNAFNVIESLVRLARDYKRTIVFTIHQPRSNIVSLFDQLVLLGQGRLVYAGEMTKCHEYFASIGHPCPPGFNIADFLIDLTSQAARAPTSAEEVGSSGIDSPDTEDQTNLHDEERGLGGRRLGHSTRSSTEAGEETELRSVASSAGGYVKRKTSQLLSIVSGNGSGDSDANRLPPRLAALVEAYASSEIAADIKGEIVETERAQQQRASGVGADGELPDVIAEATLLRGRKRASWPTQFRILSGRAFKNLYRNPALLTAHYLGSLVLALICGFFFHNVTNDISGFQNRLGIFFFTLALFGFSSLSSLNLFAGERLLFMRERANGYYTPFTYFASKVLFDIIPLRIVPPLLFGGIVYPLVGLVPTVPAFWKFMLTLVLFNLTTASVVLLLSVAFESTGVASFVGTLIMLFNILFTGLLINRETVSKFFQWLHTISFYHAAFEALAVNELRYLTLKEHKYGVDLEVPAATILSTFGLRAQTFWWPNISLLGIFFGIFTVVSFLFLQFYVKEKR
ncbi:hypothetical protein PUNSTDRAFT_102090 [Punctularia strigosozonata HHB-11173 SS5]|uniref:uncharacterized protein n=1 Tax=Punctularia strigosozonata (strain HHB-11173) TaxID=741275 RepID=UPI0004417DB7|nr:uncharacterized protein PUNSTDRAFT_102090 [Punctularia strigosozonata HHB-11173 SS5]EIN10088.1 hypothetical protein PUNSTDRAFT_102090 [Punctularia strigosozonata HHB-11173 SS5]